MPEMYDILISGGGMAGLSLAGVLKRNFGDALSVLVCDPTIHAPRKNTGRASAIAAGPRRMLQDLGVWQKIEHRAQPINDMVVTDSRTDDPVRPVYLNFGGEVAPGEPFAHMIYNDDLVAALSETCAALGVETDARACVGYDAQSSFARVRDAADTEAKARLVVAADGARSKLRAAAGIATIGWDHHQSGIVATVRHERDHQGRAEEHFLPAGPFAILPLRDQEGGGLLSSIVWTESRADADALVRLDKAGFHAALEQRFGLRLGDIEVIDQPRAWPLESKMARRFTDKRLALIGDAAHVVHPLAGQGINLGLRDVAILAEAIATQVHLGLDPGEPSVLQAYQQARRFDTLVNGMTMDALNRLFSNDAEPLRLARDFGLGIVDRLPPLKDFFIKEAAGLAGAVPKLFVGEMI